MTKQTLFQVNAFWDADSAVWVATSEDIPGLATEANSFDALQRKLRVLVPELLMLNQIIPEDYKGAVSFELTSHKQETIEMAS